ncbi:MAG: AmmeMemoRadiSam system protein B [Planctomycetes bacterium]|nr:AmmeMemoRadiSam system protein B [Planctomycetota bacterium]
MTDPAEPANPPEFDPDAAHQQRPRLRPVRGFPAKVGEQQVLGLADARQISPKIVFTSPAAQALLPMLDGTRDLDQVVSEVGHGLTREILEVLVAQLDDAGLIEGPTFDQMWEKLRVDFDESVNLPPGSSAALAEALAAQSLGEDATADERARAAPDKLREAMDAWIDDALKDAPDPSFDALPKAVMVPHIDYTRGWMNYAAAWGRLRVVDRPDRVVVLGTNHFGACTGVCGCNKGFESPLGVCRLDQALADALHARLGDGLFEHRYDHEQEHSIELQIPWIQHCLGVDAAGEHCPVFGALIHDPVVNNGEPYDGQGISLADFVDAMREVLAELGGTTLIVSSADLSHVGPAFGDQKPLVGEDPEIEEFRNKVLSHDREMLELIGQGKAEELVAAMAWQENPTRWCSTGNIVAAMLITKPDEIRILNHAAAMDEQGMALVSSAAVVMI